MSLLIRMTWVWLWIPTLRPWSSSRSSSITVIRTRAGRLPNRPNSPFAPSSSTNRQSLVRAVEEQLQYQEPRIKDVKAKCRESDQLTGSLVVEVSYTVRSTNSRYNHVYPFYLTEGSEGGGGA